MLKQYSNLTSSPKVEIVTKTVQLNYICVKATFSLYDSQDNFGRTYFQVVLSNMTDNAILSLYQLTPTNLNDINESNNNTYLNNLISLWQVSKKDEPFYETIDITKLVQNNKSSSSFSIYFIVSFDPLDKLTFDIPSKTEKIIFGELYNPNHESYIHEKIEQDIGYVGKGSVDLYNLSLFFQIINVSTTGKAPVTLSTIYNEKRSGFFGEHCPADFEYNALVLDDYVLIENPIGDHLYYQKTTVEELKNKYHLKPFKESGSFYINITDYSYIIFSPNKVNFSIINKDNSRIEFNGYTLDKKILTPLSIVRKVTSKTTIEYISSNNKVISIKSNDNDVINLIYNNNNLISKIVYGKMNYLLLEYTSINGKFLLSTVKYCNNNNPTEKEIVQNVAKYEYQSLAPYLLTFAYDKDTLQGYSYEYLNNKIHDISSKLYLSSSVNQSINIINKNNITTITNQLNEATYYYFDNYGLCYLKSDQYGNVLMKKYQDSDIGRYPYNIGESNLEKNVCDILLNGNFDNEDIEEDFKWKIEQNSIGNIEKSLGFNGKKSLRIYNITSSTFEIYETIENINSYIGKTIYFKGYVRGKGTISIKIKLDNNNYVINKDLNNIWEDIYINDINLSNTKSIKVSIIASKETDVRLSNFSLCLDEASTRDNFINNGKFNDLTKNWNMKNFTDNDIVTNQVLLEPLNKIFSKAIKITGKIDQVKSIEQKIDLSGGALEELLFSFFSKVDISRNDYFVSYIKVEYINLKEKVYSFDINRNIYEYQLVSQSIITLDAYKSVTIGLEYRGKNTIYLSDFGLYKESFGSYYSYSKQNTLTEIASGTATTNLDIDDNSRLKRIVDATGEIYQYEYDNIGNIVKITDSSGNEFSFSYDDNNFLCKTLITTKNKKTISSTKTNDENGNILLMKDYDGTTQAFEYDDKDRLIKANSSRGIVNHYQYDDKDRIEKKIYDIETETITHQFNYNKYDNYNKISIEDIQSYNYNQYDSWGNYKEIRLDNEILTKLNYYVYSNYYTGLISNKIYPNGTYTFTYDSLNRLQKITYIDKDIVSYNYDKYNKLTNKTEVNRNDEQDIYVTTYSYDKDQNVIKKQIKSKFLSEVTLNEYDNLGNIQQKSIIPDSLEILNYNYVYDYEYNEYKSGGYFSRLETSFLEDIVFEDTILKYGEAPILNSVNLEKDISINRKVIKFTKNTSSLAFQTSSINCNRMKISDGNDSFNEEEWQNKFKTYKELYVWVRIDSLTNSTSLEKIISLGDDTKEIANVSIKNNGEVIYSYNNQEVSTFWIKAKEWNLIGLALEETTLSTKLHYFINQYYNSCDLSGKYVSNITRIMFGNYHNSNVTNEQLSGGTVLSMPFDILYIGIGTYSHNQESYRGIYNEGYKYVFSRDVNPSSGVIYYNHNAYKGMDVIPLNGNLTSIKGLKPLEYTYQDNSFKIKKTKLFKLDNKRFEDDKEYTNRHIYGSYKEEIGLEGKNKSLLAYDFGLKKEGTISLRFKCDFISGYQRYLTRTILCSPTKDNGSHKLVVYIDNDNEKIKIGINRHTFSTTLNVLPETWHLFTITWDTSNVIVQLDNEIEKVNSPDIIDLTGCKTYIGSNFLQNEPSEQLGGCIEMVSYTDLYDENIHNNLLLNGKPITVLTEYDEAQRPYKKEINTGKTKLNQIYKYYDENDAINPHPNIEIIPDGTNIIYTYDINGNIIHKVISLNGVIQENIHYRYDVARRLISEKCYKGSTFVYCNEYNYNKLGDITNKIMYNSNGKVNTKEVYVYSSTIRNQLNRIDIYDKDNNIINTKEITYLENDAFRPSSYNQNELIWEGKRLISYGNNQYIYNDEGIRVSKITPNGITRYILDEDRIVKEIRTNDEPTYYHYDESGTLVGFHYNGEEYFYYRDLVGNIIKIVDVNGIVKVEYNYDAWGKVISIIGDNTIQKINSFLYKGYYYDFETELYYCKSRYYDPNVCRFISIDDINYLDIESINGLNLYCYCANNPVMYSDESGDMPKWAKKLAAGLAIIFPLPFLVDTIVETSILLTSEEYKAENVLSEDETNVHIPNSSKFNNPIAQMIYANYLYKNVKKSDGSKFFIGGPSEILGEWEAHNIATNAAIAFLFIDSLFVPKKYKNEKLIGEALKLYMSAHSVDLGPNIESDPHGHFFHLIYIILAYF